MINQLGQLAQIALLGYSVIRSINHRRTNAVE